jgi:hypothetical protein
MANTTTNFAGKLGQIIDAVAWAKTCFVIASGADGSQFLDEMKRLSKANERVRDVVGLDISGLPNGIQVEIKICEKGYAELLQQGDVSTRLKAKKA